VSRQTALVQRRRALGAPHRFRGLGDVRIAMSCVPPDVTAPGTMLEVEIREARAAVEVVALPFYSRPG
jgi:hypothetical protein